MGDGDLLGGDLRRGGGGGAAAVTATGEAATGPHLHK